MRRSEAFLLLRPRLARIVAAIALGALSLTSALALAGVSAWLITRAAQMPPVLDLSVAVVAVRTFAISRGVVEVPDHIGAMFGWLALDQEQRVVASPPANRLASDPAAGGEFAR